MKIAKLLCGVALGGLLASNAIAADLLYSQPAPQVVAAYGGPYFGAKIGANWMDVDDADFDFGGVADDSIDLDTGFTGSLVAGYAFGGRWGMLSPRIELEAGYLNNEVDTVTDGTAPALTGAETGDINALYWFANLLLDIPMSGWGFTPFIGGGVGFANVRFDNIDTNGTVIGPGVDDEDTTFAWNLTAGLGYDISRNVTFDIAYRYVQFNDVDLVDSLGGGAFVTSTDVDNHQVTAGIRVHL